MRGTTLTENKLGWRTWLALTCLVERSYPQDLVEKVLADAQFSSRNTALTNKPKSFKKILTFFRTFNPAYQNLKKIFMKHWQLISGNNN